ncbi:hypothetical protein X971_1468 [Agrobacterium tumefaciens LBA4213 (Ach5)]|nr:hypothetical protein X971_1468 [Agrobacterium tumefaciens LBA4213 (Ach5)]
MHEQNSGVISTAIHANMMPLFLLKLPPTLSAKGRQFAVATGT